MAISINICNLALGELRAPPISAIDEASTEARNCAAFYPQCLKILLEQHEWSWAVRLADLAQFSVNDRLSEWRYAFALPADIAKPLRMIPTGSEYVESTDTMVRGRHFQPFVIEGGKLYANSAAVRLEYSTNTVTETEMSAMFADALAYALASRMAVPIRDSRELKGELLKQAEIATQRAWAADQNRQPQRDDGYTDEVMSARSSGFGWYVGNNARVY